MLSRSLLLSLLAVPAALAADCYGNANPGLSASDFQAAADQVCNYGPSWQGWINGHQVQAVYQGNAKIHCRDAFSNIISQCVSGQGRNGGQWTWNYNGVEELYYIQAF
ncbi:hypothetical protein MKX07_002986 [Trichoderma sp. CBMAI-0711]|uniref:SSCRP protein n=1 Tax=Trichoderma parareesei TaxID=858221 RepID=A0A2H2ZSL6_TRIPA|nr:hypothetical protein MKX07_002986 [Trichoderma sp. CBMAI-0711]OTA08628.1 hypothetical protein A9Z42_0003340 [Trichoderma parareesei]